MHFHPHGKEKLHQLTTDWAGSPIVLTAHDEVLAIFVSQTPMDGDLVLTGVPRDRLIASEPR